MVPGVWPIGRNPESCPHDRSRLHLTEPDICPLPVATAQPRGLRSTVNAILPNAGRSASGA